MDQQPTNPQIPTSNPAPMPSQPIAQAPSPAPAPNKNKRFVLLGVGILAVIIVGVVAILLHSKKTDDGQKPAMATLTVGSHPYLYACNALTRDDIKKAGATLRDDKGGEAVSAIQAIPYNQTPGGRYDLAKTIEDPLLLGVVMSKCDYLLSDFSSFDQKHVAVTISQYPNTETAQKIFKTRQDNNKGVPFPSYKSTSLVQSSSSDKSDDIVAAILLDNRVVELKYSLGNVTPDNAAAKLDGLATTIVKNLNDTAKSTLPYNFSNLGTIGSTTLTDACHALNLKKADGILGDVHYEQANVVNDYKYGKISESSPAISAQCSVHFRYSADDAKQPDYKNQSFSDAETRFPNELVLSIASYPSESDATSAVQGLKRAKADTAVDFSYGKTSFAYTQTDTSLGYSTTSHHFLTVHGGSVIALSVEEGQVQKPYVSTIKNVTVDQAKQLLDSLDLN